MKKILSLFLTTCMFLCVNVFAADDYKIVDMKEFSKVGEFSEGLCAVQDSSSRRWGFVDVNKNWVIQPQFQNASCFKNGVCAVNTVDAETVLINRLGEVVFTCSEYYSTVDSNKVFLEKHGKYQVVFEQNTGLGAPYYVTLLNGDYSVITSKDVKLCAFNENGNTLFWENNQKRVYNYKGIDITDKLSNDCYLSFDHVLVNNKYFVGFGTSNEKLVAYDIDGNKLAEFDVPTRDIRNISLFGDVVVVDGNYIDTLVFNIPLNKQVGAYKETDTVKTYYNKYYTVLKKNGTSGLFSFGGDTLIDFGKWNYICPSSVSNTAVVGIDKYGIADYSGNLLLPMEYSVHRIQSYIVTKDGKYTTLTKDGKTFYTFDLSTLKQYTSFSEGFDVGYKYHRKGDYILDNNLNEVYCHTVEKSGYEGNIEFLANEGIIRLYYQLPSRTYGFLMFDDSGVKVNVDGERLEFDVLPVIQNGRTLVPMRAIFEALGANVEWNGETQSITAKNKDVTIQMQIGNNTLTKNGQSSQLDVSPQLIDGRTMVPVRAISDCFNVLVDWNGYTQTVSLFTN